MSEAMMEDWTNYEPPLRWGDFAAKYPEDQLVGLVVRILHDAAEEEHLIGTINPNLGVCDCCAAFSERGTLVTGSRRIYNPPESKP